VPKVKTQPNRVADYQARKAAELEAKQAADKAAADKAAADKAAAAQTGTPQSPRPASIHVDATGNNVDDAASAGTGDHSPKQGATASDHGDNTNGGAHVKPSKPNVLLRTWTMLAILLTDKLARKRTSSTGSTSEGGAAPSTEGATEEGNTSRRTSRRSSASSKCSGKGLRTKLAAGRRKLAKKMSASRRRLRSWSKSVSNDISSTFDAAVGATTSSWKDAEVKLADACKRTGSFFDTTTAKAKGCVVDVAKDLKRGLQTSFVAVKDDLRAARTATSAFFDQAGDATKEVIVSSAASTRKGFKNTLKEAKAGVKSFKKDAKSTCSKVLKVLSFKKSKA
jgi:hypothetical protein